MSKTIPPTTRPPKILVVDDSVFVRDILAAMMNEAGFEVTSAGSADETLAAVRADHDVIILDVLMPDRSGFEVRRILKQREDTRHIPVVLLTALASASMGGSRSAEARSLADTYLAKGTPGHVVISTVRSLIRAGCN